MKAITEYKVGYKPLGGWRIPLWFRYGVEVEPRLAYRANWILPKLVVPEWPELVWYSSGPRACDQDPIYGSGMYLENVRGGVEVCFELLCSFDRRGAGHVCPPVVEKTIYCLDRVSLGWMVSHLENAIYPFLRTKLEDLQGIDCDNSSAP